MDDDKKPQPVDKSFALERAEQQLHTAINNILYELISTVKKNDAEITWGEMGNVVGAALVSTLHDAIRFDNQRSAFTPSQNRLLKYIRDAVFDGFARKITFFRKKAKAESATNKTNKER